MKNLISVLILVFTFCATALAQENLPCPIISIIRPKNSVMPNNPMTFSASVSKEIEKFKPEYKWTVQGGEIIEGQGNLKTEVILKDTYRIAEYGKISFRREKNQLDNVAIELQYDKELVAIFIIYFTEEENINALKTRLANVSKYLANTHKIPKDRLRLIFGGFSRYRTEVYLLTSEAIRLHKDSPNWEESINKLKSQNQTPKKTKPRKTAKRQ